MPARQPLDSGGVTSSPPRSTKTLDAVPSHRSPTVLASTASSAPRRYASETATTFSAYDVVLRPATDDRSLRTHGTRTTRETSDDAPGPARTRTVWRCSSGAKRYEPSGPGPPVRVMRRRPVSGPAAASTAATPSRTRSRSGSASPMPSADRVSRRRWRVSAKAVPSYTAHVSKTPSPTVTPWSTPDRRRSSGP